MAATHRITYMPWKILMEVPKEVQGRDISLWSLAGIAFSRHRV